MTAARTKLHEEEKHTSTGILRTETKQKRRKQCKERKENRTSGINCNKASRLCYKAEPGIFAT